MDSMSASMATDMRETKTQGIDVTSMRLREEVQVLHDEISRLHEKLAPFLVNTPDNPDKASPEVSGDPSSEYRTYLEDISRSVRYASSSISRLYREFDR